MKTKYPVSGNRVAIRRRRRGEHGIALISVVAVLVLLTMVATPFLLTMRDSAARGERFLYSQRADGEANALFEVVRAQVIDGLEHVERRRLDVLGQQGSATSQSKPPANSTPTSDSMDELAMPSEVLERFNQSTAKEHRLWAADIVDTQSLLNLNNCSYPVLANILGRAEVAQATTSDKGTVPLTSVPPSFPKDGGIVRIGSECIKYKQVVGNELVNCERGYLGSAPGNGLPHDLEVGDVVVLESCFQVAARPFLLRPNAWVRYTHVDQARTISDMGVAAMLPADFERIRPYVTAWNGNAVGDGWCNPQLVRNNITSGDKSSLYAKVKNVRYFGPGTVVRITDGVNDDYAIVTKVRGANEVLLAGRITHDFTADQTRIYCLARSPININTASVAMLTIVFDGLRLRGKPASLSTRQAEELALFLKTPKNDSNATVPAVYTSWEDLTKALTAAKTAGKLDDDTMKAVMLNAMDANDSLLAFSTVPFVFRSYDTYEVRATVSIQGAQGRELARREIRRVMEVSTTTSGTFVLETQDDFQNQIMKSRDGKYMATFPVNVNAHFDGLNIPASEYEAFVQKNLYPSTDRTTGVGDVQLLPAAFRSGYQSNRKDPVRHFDEQRIPDGIDLKEKQLTVSVDGPYDPLNDKMDLVQTAAIPNVGDNIEMGMKEFACSFWYRPEWSRDKSEHVIFDYGVGNDHMNRVSLRYDPKRNALVLTCKDATREVMNLNRPEMQGAEVVYVFDHTTWTDKEWYHIACHVHGCSPDMMSLFVDGESQGSGGTITRLTGSVPAQTGSTFDLAVEDCSNFPDSGVVSVRGKEGVELMEYNLRPNDNTLVVSRRMARNIDHKDIANTTRTHREGDTVQLYGFTAPLFTDIRPGGASLPSTIGPWRPYRFVCAADQLTVTITAANGSTTTNTAQGLACNPGGETFPIKNITIQDWDSGDTSSGVLDDIGANGTVGIAMLISPMFNLGATTGTSNGANGNNIPQSGSYVGGAYFVAYRVVDSSQATNQIEILYRFDNLVHASAPRAAPDNPNNNRFFPTYNYNATAKTGAQSAFIPIALVASTPTGGGSSAPYLNPFDQEDQLPKRFFTDTDPTTGVTTSFADDRRGAFVQMEGEWACYDTYDSVLLSQAGQAGRVAFLRDVTLDAVQYLFGGGILSVNHVATISSSNLTGGGSGGNSVSDPPAAATEKNAETDLMRAGTTADATTKPSISAVRIANALDFRGYENSSVSPTEEFREGNTVPHDAPHPSGTPIIPAFYVITGNNVETSRSLGARFAYPGFNDLITLRDRNGNDEQIRLQWGYQGWCAATAPTQQTWNWDRPENAGLLLDQRAYDSRSWTRAIKFPSGEMPDQGLTKGKDTIVFGKKYDGTGAVSNATIDELVFWNFKRPANRDHPRYARLGTVPGEIISPQTTTTGTTPTPTTYAGIDDKADEIDVHLAVYDAAGQTIIVNGRPIDANTFAADGGIIKIDDELILFDSFDLEQGKFTGCVRGALGTTAKTHEYEATVIPIHAFPCSRLEAGVDTSSADYQLADASDFPDDGFLRFGENGEILGYTLWGQNHLSAPLGRIDPAVTRTPIDPKKADPGKKVGGSIFRGRFGTTPQAANQGDLAIAMPFRVYDRYAERADDPEQSYLQLSWTKHGAIWKRITWDADPKKNIEIVALIRFSGGPAWDADKIIHVGQDPMPGEDRREWLYQITDPKAMNLLNVEADRVEVRLGVRYAKDAYDRFAKIAPDTWKQTPSVGKVVVEYVAPPQVLFQE